MLNGMVLNLVYDFEININGKNCNRILSIRPIDEMTRTVTVTETGLYISKGETFLVRFRTDSISSRLCSRGSYSQKGLHLARGTLKDF
jgi:hypothetical protein